MRPFCAIVALVASLGLAGCDASRPILVPSPPSTSPSSSTSSSSSGSASASSVGPVPDASASGTPPAPIAESNSPRRRAATRLVVVRPVRFGKPANGFVATPQPGHTLAWCNGASRGAVDRGVYDCGSSADYGVACWRASVRATMYCLQNPFGTRLAQLALTDTALPGAPAPVVATPLGLILDDGAHCLIRDGGSWSSLPGYPDWYGTYFCTSASDQIVWAPGLSDGVDRTTPAWTVVTTGRSSIPVRHAVTVAYFAGY